MSQGRATENVMLRVRFHLEEIKYLKFTFSRSLNKAKRDGDGATAVPPLNMQCVQNLSKSGESKCPNKVQSVLMGAQRLNIRFLLPSLLYAEYNVKRKKIS